MKTFKQFVRYREADGDVPFVAKDDPDNPSTFAMDEDPETPLGRIISILWSKYRHELEPLLEKLCDRDPELEAAYQEVRDDPSASVKSKKKSNKGRFPGDDNEVRIPKADALSGEQE